MKNRYRLYVDESGDHTYKNLEQLGSRYLALTGVYFRQKDHYLTMHDGLEALKREVFGPRPDAPVILHRTDVIAKSGPFSVLRDEGKCKAFNDGILRLLAESDYTLLCVVIDKANHKSRYPSPMHPYHYCLNVMVERYCHSLRTRGAVGDVMAEARGPGADRQLSAAYKTMYHAGTNVMSAATVQEALTSNSIKLRNKQACVSGLELTDLVAQPMKQWVLTEKGLCVPQTGYSGEVAQIASKKLRRNYQGKSKGHGWVCLSF